MSDEEIDNKPNETPSILSSGTELMDQPTELDKIFKQMLDPANLHHFTELNKQEVIGFASISTMAKLADKYNIDYDIIKNWVINNFQMRVSLQRKGRLELVKITSRSQGDMNQGGQGNRGPWGFFRRD